MRRFNGPHYEDQDLLTHLDGETSPRAASAIRKHLDGCWKCRARMAELEEEMFHVTRLIEGDQFPDSDRVASAHAKLMGRLWTAAAEPVSRPVWRRRGIPWLVFATCAVMLTLLLLPRRASSPAQPQKLLTETAAAEAAAIRSLSSSGTLHQTFRVIVTQVKPAAFRRESTLEVWSDSSRGRFTSRWKDASGVLKHALWRPDERQSYAYRPNGEGVLPIAATPHEEILAADALSGVPSLDAVEQALMRWLERRRWTPVSLTDGLCRFVSADGATLTAEPIRGEDGAEYLQLRTARRFSWGTLSFALRVDEASRRPRLQSATWDKGGQVFQLQLIAVEQAPVARVSFVPERQLFKNQPAPVLAEAAPPPKPDLFSLRVAALYALHRLGACLGEPVEVVELDDAVVIRGTVGTEQRKEAIQAGLAALAALHPLRVEIESTNEAMARLAPEADGIRRETLFDDKPTADPKSPAKHPWCHGKTTKACAQARARVLAAVETSVAEAAELRNLDALSRMAPPASTHPSESGRLIDSMALAHANDLRANLIDLRRLLGELTPQPRWTVFPADTARGVDAGQGGVSALYETARDLARTLRDALSDDAAPDVSAGAHRILENLSELDVLHQNVSESLSVRQAARH